MSSPMGRTAKIDPISQEATCGSSSDTSRSSTDTKQSQKRKEKKLTREERLRKEVESVELFDFIIDQEMRAGYENMGSPVNETPRSHFERNLQLAAKQCPMLADIAATKAGTLLTDDERIAIACIFVRHAMTRTPVGRINWISPMARRLYIFRVHRVCSMARHLALVGLWGLALWEPSQTCSGAGLTTDVWHITSSVELACLFVFIADATTLLLCRGWKRFLRNSKCVM